MKADEINLLCSNLMQDSEFMSYGFKTLKKSSQDIRKQLIFRPSSVYCHKSRSIKGAFFHVQQGTG